jgi:hypothetical protein
MQAALMVGGRKASQKDGNKVESRPVVQNDPVELNTPVSFLIGTGRSGTTILYQLLSEHRRVSWVSYSLTTRPHKPQLNNLVLEAHNWPLLRATVRNRFRPSESYPFWNRLYPGFAEPCRDLLAADVNQKITARFHTEIKKLVAPSRPHFMAKITGWPRTGFLSAVFPKAKFVHIVRDGRAVAASLLNVPWWLGWRGPANWRWGPLSQEHNMLWERYDRSFVALAGIQWIILMEAFAEAKKLLPQSSFMEISYEQLCEDTIGVMRGICGFLEIEWNESFQSRVQKYKMRNTNYKWKDNLSAGQSKILNRVLADSLTRLGYTV